MRIVYLIFLFLIQSLFLVLSFRFCICMLHEQLSRWLVALHKIILAHHDEGCDCECSFCISCGELETLSIGKFMSLMLCPSSLRFHGSSIPLFDWDCIEDKWVHHWFVGLTYYLLANNKCCSVLFETAVNFAILISWRVFLNVRCLVCCTTRGRWNTGCMNQ